MSNFRDWAQVAMNESAPWFAEVQAAARDFVKTLRENSDETSFGVDMSRMPSLNHLLALVPVADAIVLLEFAIAFLGCMLAEAREVQKATEQGGVS